MRTFKSKNNKSLLKYLKHFFISGEHNNHKPHIFRSFTLFSFLLVSTFLFGVAYGSKYFFGQTVLGASIASNVLVDLTNNDRLAYNLVPLRINQKLNLAAKLKNQDMVENNYFAHNSPSGINPWHFIQLAYYNFLFAGENLAINFNEANEVEKAWMNSPLHRANLLNPKFQEIGINVAEVNNNTENKIQIVQMFGTPAIETLEVDQVIKKSEKTIKLVKTTKKIEVKIINQDKENSFVKNESTTTVPLVPTIAGTQTYSTLGERLFFESPKYVQIIFYSLMAILALGLFLLTLAEFKKHHYRHILYGSLLIAVLTIFSILNS